MDLESYSTSFWSRIPNWLFAAGFLLMVIIVLIQMFRGGALICANGDVLAPSCKNETEGVPNGTIVLTSDECRSLGQDWRLYQPAAGRVPIAAGVNTDHSGEERTFVVGQSDKEGEYEHALTVDEMPSHSHSYLRSVFLIKDNKRKGRHATYDSDESRPTEETGGNRPHNNLPPYIVLNFCQKRSPDSHP